MSTQVDVNKGFEGIKPASGADAVWLIKNGKYLVTLRVNTSIYLGPFGDKSGMDAFGKGDSVSIYLTESYGSPEDWASTITCKRDGASAYVVQELRNAIDRAPDYEYRRMHVEVIQPICRGLQVGFTPVSLQRFHRYKDRREKGVK